MRDLPKKLAVVLLVAGPLPGAQGPYPPFYPDDPLLEEPPPLRLEEPAYRKLNDYYDVLAHTLREPGERQPASGDPIRALSTHTLDEVPDGAWFTNRIGSRPMTPEELRRGPRQSNAPDPDGVWTIVGAKTQGVTPGFQIVDARGERYLLKFDPIEHPEMATAADVIGSLIFHALGYHVPENYIVTFERDKLVIGEGATTEDALGQEQPISETDVNTALTRVGRTPDGRIRAVASYFLPGTPLGEFRYFGTRSDDFNDTVPHEHRRELRGLFVFAAWVNHNDSRSINTFDTLIEEGGLRYVRHYLIDFGATLGSASVLSNTARDGNAYFFETGQALAQILTLGVYVPWWARANYFESRAAGMLMVDPFEPENWKPNYPNPAFLNRLPDDTFWAAKKVMAFSDAGIRAIVEEGQYSSPEDTRVVADYLIQRRDRIGETYFERVLPLDGFRIAGDTLLFDDLAVVHGFRPAGQYRVEWSEFDNQAGTHTPIPDSGTFRLPAALADAAGGDYLAATIRDEAMPGRSVVVFVRKEGSQAAVVGLRRDW